MDEKNEVITGSSTDEIKDTFDEDKVVVVEEDKISPPYHRILAPLLPNAAFDVTPNVCNIDTLPPPFAPLWGDNVANGL